MGERTGTGAARAWVGFGANLGEPERQFAAALDHLLADGRLALTACSSLYRTAPWGRVDQPEFLNAVVALSGEPDPEALLRRLQAAEGAGGRRRDAGQWGPRTIDLDLLAFEGQAGVFGELVLPHPRIVDRAFVLIPLVEIAPQLEIAAGLGAAQALARLPDRERAGVQRVGPFRYPVGPAAAAASQ
jgi:2-amino-4-hydroxy-6-hydroxymethyldihydropteridine diphosphokinase